MYIEILCPYCDYKVRTNRFSKELKIEYKKFICKDCGKYFFVELGFKRVILGTYKVESFKHE